MSTRPSKLETRFLAVAGLVFMAAQLTRWVWPDVITYNAGLAFSWQLPGALPVVISSGFLVLVGWWWYRTRAEGTMWATYFGLIFGGGASNLLERLLFGGQVADYINLFNLTTANLADFAIIAGLVGVIGRIALSK